MRVSMRLGLVGALLVAVAVGLFLWGTSADLGTDAAEAMRRIGQVAGAVGGLGAVLLALALMMRLRGR
ncbi:MAG: hypothetical protein MUE52_18940 [Tabrizicola sp.]|jgi:hypothetical protein|nr:hypothetical protein [Tabrizicola sp.]